MASIVPRRASYHVETERRSSMKAALASGVDRTTHSAKLEQEQQQPQQPSPQVPKSIKLGGGHDADNNQEEESVVEEEASVDGHDLCDEASIRPASPVRRIADGNRHLQELRKLAATSRASPLTTARLHEENAALKRQLVQLGNQHELEVQALKSQLEEAAFVHERTEISLKKRIGELEKQQREAAESSEKYRSRVEALQQVIHQLESHAKGSVALTQAPVTPLSSLSSPPKVATWKPAPTPRLGIDSPVPHHTNLTKNSGIKQPFAWRAEASPALHSAPATPSRVRMKAQGRTSFVPTSAAAIPAAPRCIPVPTFDVLHTAPAYSPQYVLPPPLAATKQQQQRQAPSSKVFPGGSLLSYCAEVITSRLAAHVPGASTPKANMKVMPMLSAEDVSMYGGSTASNGITIPVPDAQTLADDEYTAITIL